MARRPGPLTPSLRGSIGVPSRGWSRSAALTLTLAALTVACSTAERQGASEPAAQNAADVVAGGKAEASLQDTTAALAGDVVQLPPSDVAFGFGYDACPGCPDTPLCEAGTTQCWSPYAVQTCNGDGTGFCVEKCADGSTCLDGACCAPSCAGRECGSDGCFGSCGQCPGDEACSEGECTSVLCNLTDGATWVRGGSSIQSFDVLADGRSVAVSPLGELVRFGGDGLATSTVSFAPPNVDFEPGRVLALASGTVAVPWNEMGVDKALVPGVALIDPSDGVTRKAWPGPGNAFVQRVVESDGGLLLAGGRTLGDTGASSRLWVVRADVSGDKVWDKEVADGDVADGDVETRFVDAAPAPDGGVAILALQYPEAGPWAAKVVRVSASGEKVGATLLSSVAQPAAITAVDGGWLVLGPPHASSLTRLDSLGAIVWSQPLPDAQVTGACAAGDGALLVGAQVVITQPADGSDAYAAGTVRQYGWLRRVTAAGELVWEHRYGHPLVSNSLIVVGTTEAGHILAAGTLRLRAASDGSAPECGAL